jgi:hypothetical protein
VKSGVGVEKGTKAVISVNFSLFRERTFNNLRTNFLVEIPLKKSFSTPTGYLQQRSRNRSAPDEIVSTMSVQARWALHPGKA